MIPVQRVSVRGRSLSSKHAAEHSQSLDVTYMAVMIQTVESMKRNHISHVILLHLQRGEESDAHRVSSRWRPNGCLAQGVSVSGSESGLRS